MKIGNMNQLGLGLGLGLKLWLWFGLGLGLGLGLNFGSGMGYIQYKTVPCYVQSRKKSTKAFCEMVTEYFIVLAK